MEKLTKPAILVVDMLNDFVTGSLACERGKAIVPATAQLLDAARKAGVPVIFCNDAHIAGIDRELGVKTVIMTGLHAHMCVRHTSADAFCLGYDVVVAKEATDSFTEEDYKAGLAYLKTCYGADAYSNEELIAAF